MKPKAIEFEIDTETGEASIDIQGMQGPACEQFIKEHLEPLFGTASSEQKKPEYHVRPQTQVKQKVRR